MASLKFSKTENIFRPVSVSLKKDKSYKDAIKAHNRGDWNSARGLYEELLNKYPDDRAARSIQKKISLVDSEKKINGSLGFIAVILIFAGLALSSTVLILPRQISNITFPIGIILLFTAPFLGFFALFQRGILNKVTGFVIVAFPVAFVLWMPSMNDYADRAKFSEGILAGADHKISVMEFYQNYNKLPSSAAETGIEPVVKSSSKYVDTVTLEENGVIIVTFSQDFLDGGKIILRPSPSDTKGVLTWNCSVIGDLARKNSPSSCK